MCYSAQVQADYKKYVVMFGATMSIRDFYEIFYRRGLDPRIKIPKAVEASFRDPQSDDERAIEALIDEVLAANAAMVQCLPDPELREHCRVGEIGLARFDQANERDQTVRDDILNRFLSRLVANHAKGSSRAGHNGGQHSHELTLPGVGSGRTEAGLAGHDHGNNLQSETVH